MAEPQTYACPACGAAHSSAEAAEHCSVCPAPAAEPKRQARSEEFERVPSHEGFSATWCAISLGVVSILTAAIVVGLPMVVPAFDFEGSAGMLLAIPVWFVSGMLVGLIAPGRTFFEPVVATSLVAAPTAFLLFSGQTVKMMPAFMYVLMSALGVFFTLIGSMLGERIQVGSASPGSD
jgi:drug/metabolite transporter (DMT)-like permease